MMHDAPDSRFRGSDIRWMKGLSCWGARGRSQFRGRGMNPQCPCYRFIVALAVMYVLAVPMTDALAQVNQNLSHMASGVAASNESLTEPSRNMWKVGIRFGGSLVFPLGPWVYRDMKPGSGEEGNLLLALSRNYAMRATISRFWAKGRFNRSVMTANRYSLGLDRYFHFGDPQDKLRAIKLGAGLGIIRDNYDGYTKPFVALGIGPVLEIFRHVAVDFTAGLTTAIRVRSGGGMGFDPDIGGGFIIDCQLGLIILL